jgi:hypothetical protein
MSLITHHLQMPKLSVNGAVTPFDQFAFLACTGMTSPSVVILVRLQRHLLYDLLQCELDSCAEPSVQQDGTVTASRSFGQISSKWKLERAGASSYYGRQDGATSTPDAGERRLGYTVDTVASCYPDRES